MTTEAKVYITAQNRAAAGVNQAIGDIERLSRSAEQTAKLFNKIFAFGVGFGFTKLLRESAEASAKAGQAGGVFASKLDTVKASFQNLLAAKGGLPEVNQSLDTLTKVLQDPAIVQAADTFFSSLITGAAKAATGIAEIVGGLRQIGLRFGIGTPTSQQEKLDAQDRKIEEAQKRLKEAQANAARYDPRRPEAEGFKALAERIQADIDILVKAKDAIYAAPDKRVDVSAFSEAEKKRREEAQKKLEEYLSKIKAADQATQTSVQKRLEFEKQIAFLRQANIDSGGKLGITQADSFNRLRADQEKRDLQDYFETLDNRVTDEAKQALEDLTKGFQGVADQGKEATDQLSVYAEQGARNMQDAFAQFLFDPFKDGIKGLLKGFIDVLRQMVAQAASAKIFEALGFGTQKSSNGSSSGGSSVLGDFFRGLFGFANGGDFTVGGSGGTDSKLVAFKATPGESVSIRKPGQGNGGVTVVNNNYIDARTDRTQIAQMIEASTQRAVTQANAEMSQLIRRGAFA